MLPPAKLKKVNGRLKKMQNSCAVCIKGELAQLHARVGILWGRE